MDIPVVKELRKDLADRRRRGLPRKQLEAKIEELTSKPKGQEAI